MLLPKIVAREELQGPLIISSESQEKRGGVRLLEHVR